MSKDELSTDVLLEIRSDYLFSETNGFQVAHQELQSLKWQETWLEKTHCGAAAPLPSQDLGGANAGLGAVTRQQLQGMMGTKQEACSQDSPKEED